MNLKTNWIKYKPGLFKYIREQTIVCAVVIAYYGKFYVNSVELACPDHVVVCSLLKLEHSVDMLAA